MTILPINTMQIISGGCMSCITGELPDVIDLNFLCLYAVIIPSVCDDLYLTPISSISGFSYVCINAAAYLQEQTFYQLFLLN